MKDKYDNLTQDLPFQEEGELLMKHCTRTVSDGVVSYDCKKGLWGTAGAVDNESRVRREAEHYFIQYFDDGEYDDLF